MKQMQKDQLAAHIASFMSQSNVLVLATCSESVPRATPMDYYCDGLTVYVFPGPGQKWKNLEANPVVSFAIVAPFTGQGDVKAIQVSSSKIAFLRKGDDGFERAAQVYRWSGKDVYLRIIPEKIELLEFALENDGYSSRQVLTLDTEGE